MNWFNILKNEGLVNLPKFKVKPFNVNKPDKEDRECKDKIMEIVNFTENFQFPNEIAQEFVKVKEKTTDVGNEISYGGEKLNVKIYASTAVIKRDFNNIPEEVYCELLDMLMGDFTFRSKNNVAGTGYNIAAVKQRQNESISQHFEIRKDNHGLLMWVSISLVWPEWFNYKQNTYVDGKQSRFIDEELSKLADEIQWSI